MKLTVSGFEGIDATLRELKIGQRRTAARRVQIEALQPFVETAKRMAPVDDGQLRDSITVGTNVTKALRRLRVKDGVTVFAGTSNRNGVPREFGTVRSVAQPFMRPAWDRHRMGALNYIVENFGKEIMATVEKAAKRNRRKK